MKKLFLVLFIFQTVFILSGTNPLFSQGQEFRITGGNTLDLYEVREPHYQPYGVVTIIKERDPQGNISTRIDLESPRSGSTNFVTYVRNIIASWNYQNFPNNSKIKITVNAIEGAIKVDLTELSKNFPDITFAAPNQYEKYVRATHFNPRKIHIRLYPQVLQKIESKKGVLRNFIDKLNPIFFVIFLILFLGMLGLSLYYEASVAYSIYTILIGAVILLLLYIFKPMQLSIWFIALYSIFWLIIGGLSLMFSKKSVLHEGRIERPKEKLDKILTTWEKAVGKHRKLFIERASEEDKEEVWEQNVGKVLRKLLNKKELSAPVSPWGRIIRVGIENHLNNRLEWYTSQEIDRGIEKQIDAEIDSLKGAGLDWMWAIAGISPMIGLLGTVVGIARSFGKISTFGLSNTQERITQLAGGINVALYTTIVGLIIGLVSLLFYYLIKAKIDSIKSRWVGKIIEITNSI